jgi:hypothetical protein
MLCIVTKITEPLRPMRVDHAKGIAFISQGNETLVWTRSFPDNKNEVWNEISRFREAVVKTQNTSRWILKIKGDNMKMVMDAILANKTFLETGVLGNA